MKKTMKERETFPETLSEIYHVLRAPRRCYTIQILSRTNSQINTRPLARTITANEQNIPEDSATGDPYRNVYNSLTQTHLPALADADVIIYDSNRQVVEPGRNHRLALLLIQINRVAYQTLRQERCDSRK